MIEKTILTIKQIIENNGVIFDFDYPFYNEEKRKDFEKHFIDHFYYDEIGLETVSKFKHRLEDKLNMIMPYYNKIFLANDLEQRILDNYDVTEDSERILNNTISSNSNSKMKNKYSDKPMTRTTLSDNDYNSNNLDMMYDLREKFCKEVNAMFNLNIKVSKREVETDDRKNNFNYQTDNRE